jgi:hypothetical protein
MPSNSVTIVSVLTSGVITPSIVAGYALRARSRDERLAAHERQLALLEDALNNVSRERRLLYVGYSIWRHGTDPMDPKTLDNDEAVTEAVEAVWISENHLRIRFGEAAPVTTVYGALVDTLDVLMKVYNRHGDSAGNPPGPVDQRDWIDANNAVVRAQKHFVTSVRDETGPVGRVRVGGPRTRRLWRPTRRAAPR